MRKIPYRVPKPDQIEPYLRSVPVNLDALIRDHGILLEEAGLEEGVSSTLHAEDGKFRIRVSAGQGEVRRRFAAAYELSRILLTSREVIDHAGPMVSYLFMTSPPGGIKTGSNREAERLAAGLLMPAAGLREMHGSGKTPKEISDAYLTTPKAVLIRLRTLSLEPRLDISPAPADQRPEQGASSPGFEPQP